MCYAVCEFCKVMMPINTPDEKDYCNCDAIKIWESNVLPMCRACELAVNRAVVLNKGKKEEHQEVTIKAEPRGRGGASPELAPPVSPTALHRAKRRWEQHIADHVSQRPAPPAAAASTSVEDIHKRFENIDYKLDRLLAEMRSYDSAKCSRKDKADFNGLCINAVQTFSKAIVDVSEHIKLDDADEEEAEDVDN